MLATIWTHAGHCADQFLRSGNAVNILLPKYILMMMWTILFSCNALFLRIKTIIYTKIEEKSRDEVAIKYRNKRSGILHYKVIK